MPSIIDILIGLLLSYYWTGIGMVTLHFQMHPIDRPGYVDGPIYKKVVSGAMWPIVAKLNREFIWFSITFLSGVIVFSYLHSLAYPYLESTELIVLAIGIIRIIPGVSAIINMPLALLAMLLWLFIAKAIGTRVPSGIERMQQK